MSDKSNEDKMEDIVTAHMEQLEKLEQVKQKLADVVVEVSNDRTNAKIILLVAIISFTVGASLSYLLVKQQEVKVSYISQTELLELEKARLAAGSYSTRQLFLGKPEKAIELIEAAQKSRTKGSNIVLISQSAIYGKNVVSISKEIHTEILQQLEEKAEHSSKK